ncbi:hypothetical protein CSB45_02170 [candidate division KSB3 bacterium]|uniref:Chordopoxvirus fusion protein n=1 Tax=candidate division KSB3 bacterium TaxID=2044937 RepID=A0A2G6EA37_9BACT|nr:MAG: hypothetical protein CSB45_02170 [candidate division KSB3 bacterium]PIE30888.1 MAG: hypothetical protein CSA57_00780 [candidate division KSB3 bacterium]
MFDTLQIYDDLSKTMEAQTARKLVNVMSSMYEELRNSVTKEEFSDLKDVVKDLAEAQKRTEIRLDELAEAQKRTELRVEELAEAQKRTEIRVEELAEAQKRTEVRLEELAEAQKRTELRLEELAEAQKRTEIRVDELAEAQKRTEKSILQLSKRLDQNNKQLGGLNMTVGYTLENEAYRFLPDLLFRDWGIELTEPLRRDWLRNKKGVMMEINILGQAKRAGEAILLIGESKLQLSRKYVDQFLNKRIRQFETDGQSIFPVIVAHMESEPGVTQYAKGLGVAVYLSYQFQRSS